MELNYAADAGLEDGIWKSDNEQVPLDPYDYTTIYSYTLPQTLNDKNVNVDIQQIGPLDGLESDANGTTPASPPLSITAGVINQDGDFEIRLSYDTPEVELLVDRVAVWLPPEFAYVNNSGDSIIQNNPTQMDWNGKSSGLAGEQIDGIDIDTFDVSAPIINPGDTSANMTYSTQQDNWNLIYHILAFRTDQGILTPSGTGVFSWN